MQSRKNSGFTLVEILIVVVILGILAAIVIPQFTNASEAAKQSSAVSTLQAIRSQLELARNQHNGAYPDLTQAPGWGLMTQTTDATYDVGGDDFGPYLQQAPVNPLAPAGVDQTSVGTGTDVAWQYNPGNGTIAIVIDSSKATELGIDVANDPNYVSP